MSRYTIAAHPPYHYCVVGYDPPLGTRFAQIYRQRRPQHPAVLALCLGAELQERPTVGALIAALAASMTVPADILRCLRRGGRKGWRPNVGVRLLRRLQHHAMEPHR